MARSLPITDRAGERGEGTRDYARPLLARAPIIFIAYILGAPYALVDTPSDDTVGGPTVDSCLPVRVMWTGTNFFVCGVSCADTHFDFSVVSSVYFSSAVDNKAGQVAFPYT